MGSKGPMFGNVDGATPDDWATVQANMGLVVFFVNRLRVPEQRREDAISDGMFGLLRAVQKFDPAKGFRFSSYAGSWIMQAIQRGRYYQGDTNHAGDELTALSLDHVYGDDQDLLDVLPAGDDPAMSAEALLVLDTAVSECGDDFDRDVLAALIEGRSVNRVGIDRGVTGEAARRRSLRLKARIAEHHAA